LTTKKLDKPGGRGEHKFLKKRHFQGNAETREKSDTHKKAGELQGGGPKPIEKKKISKNKLE